MFLNPMNTPVQDWRGKRIWIVGASSGIGAALARQALASGARVALSARRVDALEQVARAHSDALIAPFDVVCQPDWHAQYARICQAWGGVDLLLYCAAQYRPERSWEVQGDTAEASLRSNLGGAYRGIATVLPDMLADGHGGIALVASVAGYVGLPTASVYGPGKAALINLAEILYSDLHGRGLDVYLINPGFVQTPLTDKNSYPMPALQTPEQAAQAIWQGIAQGRFEIHFPWRFTSLMKLFRLLPFRWRTALLQRFIHAT